jgi:hypothetical protein
MAFVRETIRTAFFNLLAGTPGFAHVSRRIILMECNSPTIPLNQPAMEILEDGETTNQRGRGLPPIHILHAIICVWARVPDGLTPGVPDGVTPGASILNPLIDAIEARLAPDGGTENVLGLAGKVSHAWIEGETVLVPGDQNPEGQCFAAIPVRIMVP